ncbi:MAG: hypothetical protein GKR98_16790 [Boseongicola sp.]|nr:MAG: hypothetical protein GKR98_16790 [Boseongicola sp.]
MTIKPLSGQSSDLLKIVLPAAATGKTDALRVYIEAKPGFLSAIGPHGRTVLWEAAHKGKLDTLEYLIGAGADLEARGGYYRDTKVEVTPLCIAMHHGRDKAAAMLRAAGAKMSFDTACFLGDMAYLGPAIVNKPRVVNIAFYPPEGYRPLHYAVAGGQAEVAEFLLNHGADAVTDGGRLMYMSFDLESDAIARMLFKAGARPRPGDANDVARDPKWAPFLKEYGFTTDINAADRHGFPPIVEMCRGNHNATDNAEAVRDLLAQGAEVNIRDHKGKTALHRAAQAGFLSTIAVLIETGANLEATDVKGETPLFDAIRAGRALVVENLLYRGANAAHENNLGQCPGKIALRMCKPDSGRIKSLLKE